MDINSFISREDIQKEQEKRNGEMNDGRFWRIPDGKATIRLLPRLESKVPWKTVYSHRWNKSGEKIFSTCPTTFGKKDCPICKKSWAMWNSENKDIKDMGYQVRKTPRYLFNCFIVNDPDKKENNGTVKIISVGKKLFELVLESYNSEDLGPVIFDAVNGVDFEINRKKSGDNPDYPDYSSSRFVFKKYGVVKSWKEIQDQLINVDELIKEETVEELKEKFKFLGFDTADIAAPKAKTKTKVEEKAAVEDDEDIDTLTEENLPEEKVTDIDSDDIDIEDELDKL